MERLFAAFDAQYQWGSQAGEPSRGPSGNGGLRNYWCYWIDAQLEEVERVAAMWLRTVARPAVESWKGGDGSAEKYLASEFDSPAGFLTANRLRFPRPNGSNPGNDQSVYGMWGGEGLGPK